MRHRFGLTLTALAFSAVALPLTGAAQERLSFDQPGIGLRQGYAVPLGWGTSVAADITPESVHSPRQYSLAGEVRTALSDQKALSVGIKYRVFDMEPGASREAPPANGFSLAPGYQVRLGYQHSALSLFGLSFGRDADFYSSTFDPASPYPRQLSFTGLHWLSPSWAISYDVLSADLDSPSPMRLQGLGLRFGLRYRF
jgi:hypothetical protein